MVVVEGGVKEKFAVSFFSGFGFSWAAFVRVNRFWAVAFGFGFCWRWELFCCLPFGGEGIPYAPHVAVVLFEFNFSRKSRVFTFLLRSLYCCRGEMDVENALNILVSRGLSQTLEELRHGKEGRAERKDIPRERRYISLYLKLKNCSENLKFEKNEKQR